MKRPNLLSGPQIIMGGLSIATGWLALALLGLFVAVNLQDFFAAALDALAPMMGAGK
jgi:hydroxyethylthiazole kinase-like sugar kinase family protein